MEARLESLNNAFQLLGQTINNGTDTQPATDQFMTSVKWFEQWITSQELARQKAEETPTLQLVNEIESVQRDIELKEKLLSEANEALIRWEAWLEMPTTDASHQSNTNNDSFTNNAALTNL